MLETAGDEFLWQGRPFRIVAGAMHYFRIHPEQWTDRIEKARLLGLNTIDVYVPWNAHQPRPGEMRFDGILDLPRYLGLIAEAGLKVLFRPGPYICAEWDGGGLPAWLTSDPSIKLRTSDPAYLKAVDEWFDQLIPVIEPFLAHHGGPIIAVQVENEYGAFGDDEQYLRHIVDGYRRRGITELLFTCDQAHSEEMLRNGGLDDVLRTGTFGGKVDTALATLRKIQPTGPLMCAEFWNGWFDHWGGPHHTRDGRSAADDLEKLLAAGGSVSLYMFHGGTNFGFTSGANLKHAYEPTITSYDYDAPLAENGDITRKYELMRAAIAKHVPVPDQPLPAPAPTVGHSGIVLDSAVSLLDVPGTPVESAEPLTMEALGQADGFVIYRTTLPEAGPTVLTVTAYSDRVQVFLDGNPAGLLERSRHERSLPVVASRPGAELTLVVENAGRVNYGPGMLDPKGLLGPVTAGGAELSGWTQTAVPLDDVTGLPFAPAGTRLPIGPTLRRGEFTLDTVADSYLALPGWERGAAWINGFPLGRFAARGPQRTLYVPAPVLKAGVNEIVVLELQASSSDTVDLLPEPDLGIVAD
ncbi:glycoside hydrolase family 35 protein [Actinoplanes couchii]|uniref:Beta-galactosidase n=1 Tax=Actinoplanes couchii TaxID=403638 RepID=A0ABQ3XH44_9ACTN|nr:beta-galactosidase family protein [Actinoplanes couchii]MDR6320696.1 beta-galactosidase [Actinoplanes couchii]GID57818.1 beta-galactosidase [Actinoplanes couchii]